MAAAETLTRARVVRGPRFELSETAFAYLLNVPAILTVLLLVAYPIVDAFWLSLHRYNLRRPEAYAFVGLQNYVDVVTSDQFLPSLSVTLFFTFWSTFGVLVLALVMALVANEQIPQRPHSARAHSVAVGHVRRRDRADVEVDLQSKCRRAQRAALLARHSSRATARG